MLWDPTKDKETKVLSEAAKRMYKAAEFLEQHEWTIGSYHKPSNDSYCFIGAYSHGNGISLNEAYQYAYSHLGNKGYFELVDNVIGWNDHMAKNKREVVAKMREIASKL